jgi:beta-N-acetylhexosaminidase
MPVDALQKAILRLYGPQGGGQVMSGRLLSFSLDSLGGILEGGAGNEELETSLRQSRWVVINMLDAEPAEKQAALLKRFLSERQSLLRDKNVVIFAFNAPYYLDATDISKLTAYYCLYGRSAPFVEIAARLLFRELAPVGALPVSVAGVGYDLFSRTTPAPDQVIELFLDLPEAATPASPQALEPTATSSFNVGDTVGLRTGVILDHNDHPVPDGTVVRFSVASITVGGLIQELEAATVSGIARVSFKIDRAGLLEVRATSDPAMTSFVLQLGVSGEGLSVTVVTPTPMSPGTPTPGAPAPSDQGNVSALGRGHPGFGSWLLTVAVLGGLSYLAYWLGCRRSSKRWGIRWGMCTAAGGLSVYTLLALRIPGIVTLLQRSGLLGVVGGVLLGAAAGFGGAFAWLRLRELRTKA